MNRLKHVITGFAANHNRLIIALTLLLTIAAGSFFPSVTMDTDPENMLESDEPSRVFHNQTKQKFNLSEVVVLGVIDEQNPDGVFTPETLRNVYELTEFAKTLRWPDEENPGQRSGVLEVDMIAPSLVDHMSQQGPGTIKFEWLMPRAPETREEALAIRDRALSNPLLKGRMVSDDGKALCIYLPLSEKLLSYKVYTELRRKIGELGGGAEYHITGLPVAEGAVGVEMFTQMGVACPLAMAVIFALLLLFFRKLVMIVLPMIIATVSIVMTMGLMIAFGFPVHILSSMLPIFLMSIAMVDSVHVISEFFDVYTPEKGRKQAIMDVMGTLYAPMLYTSLTTAVGFLSLVLAPIPPARVFGVFLSVGVLIAWVVTVMFVPAYIMSIPEHKLAKFGLSKQESEKKNLLTRQLAVIEKLTYHRAKAVVVVLAALIAVSIWGITRIQINDNYAKRFDHSHPIRQADTALNSHFSGTYTAYLVLEGEKKDAPDSRERQQFGEELKRFGREIREDYPAAPAMAERAADGLSGSAQSFDEFLDAAEQSIDGLAENTADDEFDALQEIQAFIGLEREKGKLFKRPEVLAYMADLQAWLLAEGFIGSSYSAADVVRKVNQELIDGKAENFRIPSTLQGVSECYMQYQQSHRPDDLWHLVTPDYMSTCISLQFPCGDSMKTKAAVKAVDAYMAEHPLPAGLSADWAGLHYINLVLEAKLVWGFLKSFAGSFLIVFIMMSFQFRSVLWGLLCMLPLTITLLAIYGLTGLVGKDYDLPVAVLSALSIGMAVDFAIHFLERSRASVQAVGSWSETAPKMFGEPARAISRNVLVIALGFLPLMTASLVPYKTTGALLFLILACSGLITLFALPAILTVAEKHFFKQNPKDKEA